MNLHTHSGVYPLSFLFGFFAFCFFEIAVRGRTHWTMGLLGGGALCMLLWLMRHLRKPFLCALLGTCYITAAEFCAGVYDNLFRGWQVWDYTDRAFHVYGQICPLFSCLWFLLCLPGCMLVSAFDRQLRRAETE